MRSLGLGATHDPHKQAVALRPEEHKLQRSLQRVATRKSGSETRTAEHGAEDDEDLLADCARYALIHTSLNSIAANHVPAILVRALEAGVWTPDRVLAAASRIFM